MRRRLLAALATGVPLITAAVYLPTASAQPQRGPASVSTPLTCSPQSVKAPAGTKVENVTAVQHPAGTVDVPEVWPLPADHVDDVPAFCDVSVTLTHPGVGDHAKVRVWLPLQAWNGRLQTIGGSAYAAVTTERAWPTRSRTATPPRPPTPASAPTSTPAGP